MTLRAAVKQRIIKWELHVVWSAADAKYDVCLAWRKYIYF